MPSAARQPEYEERMNAVRFAGGRMSGSIVRAHIDWVRDYRDRDEVISFFEALPQVMRNVLAASWYPFDAAMEVDRLIMNRFGNGDPRFLEELGAYSARQALTGVDRFMQPFGIHEFFHRAASLHRRLHDLGTDVYFERAPSAGRFVHIGYCSVNPLYCSTSIGFYRECIRLHGAADVMVRESTCQCAGNNSCTYELSWT